MAWMGLVGAAAISYLGNERSNKASSDEAEANRGTSIELANTAHQREVKDLEAAGLNPILSASKGGSGAAVPSFQMPTITNSGHSAASAGYDAYRSIKEGERKDEENRASEQNRKIKEPVATLAGDASVGIQSVKAGVKGAVEAALESVAPLKNAAAKAAESFSGASAAGIDKLKGAAEGYGNLVKEMYVDKPAAAARAYGDALKGFYIDKPNKLIDSVVNSAKTGGEVMTKRSIGGPNNWSSDHGKNVKDISTISDPATRAQARRQYDMWRSKYGR